MTDIVERLRDPKFAGAWRHLQSLQDIDSMFAEAADKIERLTRERDSARAEAIEECAAAAIALVTDGERE